MAVRDHLDHLKEDIHPAGTIYERGDFVGPTNEWDIGIAEIDAGNAQFSVEAERAIAYFKPDILLLVGIAHALQDIAIGDVIVATEIYGYESGKVDSSFLTRPKVGQSAYRLLQRARAEARKKDWLKRINKVTPTSQPSVHMKPIAAGEKVIMSAQSATYNFLRNNYNDALAIELGGVGFLNTVLAYPNIDAVVIRGISKLVVADQSLEPEKEQQQIAAHHASAFAFEILSKLELPSINRTEQPIYPIHVENGTVYIGESLSSSDSKSYPIEDLTKENYHNLPEPSYKSLVGRDNDLKDLLYRISPDFHERIITLTGIGGVGKTSLALETAYVCLAAQKESKPTKLPVFDAIVFSSARLTTLLPQGIIPIQRKQKPIKTLQDLCADIDNTLKKCGLKDSDPARQASDLQEFLSSGDYRILIILDNLEALRAEDTHQIIEFLKSIKGSHIKTIITTRHSDRYDINLKELSREASQQMISNLLLTEHLVSVNNNNFDSRLYEICGGVPLAIHYAIGFLQLGHATQTVLDRLANPQGDLCRYCFDKLTSHIEEQNPIGFRLFLTLSISSYGLTCENLFTIAGINLHQRDEAEYALNMLDRCSLVFYADGRHRMLPLTRRYALSKLESNADMHSQIREEWINRYLDIAIEHGREDKGEWHEKYDAINNEWGTFKEVFTYCQAHQKYEVARQLWRALSRFAYLYSYWIDRLEWSSWLMDVAQYQGDSAFLAELKSASAWLALLRGGDENLKKSEELLKSAWYLSEKADLYVKNTIVINLATLYLRKPDFKKSQKYFIKSVELRRSIRGHIDEFRETRLKIRFLFYQGESFYRQEDYRIAKKLYSQVIKKAENIHWLRLKVKACERLAYIAILENDLKTAENLLNDWYAVTARNHDYRRLAFFERGYAKLEFKKKNYQKSKEWAMKALKRFKDLKMLVRVNKMEHLIDRCDAYIGEHF
ncbi:hypothetical protein IXB50_13475 [Leptothoe spongobia TAU-MAC 1115]|uniref:Nucleoside phosphorylase domain-containing protein n=2 Tax=Leptothoe TaxID=2651725 RepID=A0A947GKI7_9CYAN|nr:hypothetical protein [Leptothoe spongobia TAU-MAC 1115]